MLIGKKVTLRPVRRADIPNFLIWFNDPEVTQYLRLYLPMTEMAEEKWLESLAGNVGVFIFRDEKKDGTCADGRVVYGVGFVFFENQIQRRVFGKAFEVGKLAENFEFLERQRADYFSDVGVIAGDS